MYKSEFHDNQTYSQRAKRLGFSKALSVNRDKL